MKDTNSRVKKTKKTKKSDKSFYRKEDMIEHQCARVWLCTGHLHPIMSQRHVSRATTASVTDRARPDPLALLPSVCRSWSLRQLCGEQTDTVCQQWATARCYKQQQVRLYASGAGYTAARDLQLEDTFVHSAASYDILWLWDDIVMNDLVSSKEWLAVQ